MTDKKPGPKILDLDELVKDEFIVKLNGKEHKLHPVTLGTFLENVKDIEKVGKAASVEDEIAMTRKMLQRAFPTMETSDLDGLTMLQMNSILEFAYENNGQKATEKKLKEDGGTSNPPPAA
jgi:hypothetical protein